MKSLIRKKQIELQPSKKQEERIMFMKGFIQNVHQKYMLNKSDFCGNKNSNISISLSQLYCFCYFSFKSKIVQLLVKLPGSNWKGMF